MIVVQRPSQETWVVSEGAIGMERQAEAVAEAVGLPFVLKRVSVGGPLGFAPWRVQLRMPASWLLRATTAAGELKAPWPRLLISIGQKSVPIALAIKRLCTADTFTLHIQNPNVQPEFFDLVTAPLHDGLTGANVVTTFGAVHSVTPEKLREAMPRFSAQIESLPRPRVAVLLGGNSWTFTFSAEDAERLGRSLADMMRATCGSLMVTPSRRTSAETITALSNAIKDVPHLIYHSGENPYYAFLGFADALIVTEDSVNLVTEAAGTGKPVYVQSLRGGSQRLRRFHKMMRDAGITRPFEGKLEFWTYKPINETQRVADRVKRALGLYGAPDQHASVHTSLCERQC